MKVKPQTRFLTLQSAKIDAEGRTIEFPFSSEAPVDRFFGSEILDHGEGSADLSRLNDGANVLFNHNMDDVVGVVESARINTADRRGYARIRFARTARADELIGMVNDGILRNVSFSYEVRKIVNEGNNVARVKAWAPLEVSIVTVPADASIGIGRGHDNDVECTVVNRQSAATKEGKKMADEATTGAAADTRTADIQVGQDHAALERQRITGITNLARKHKIEQAHIDHWVNEGVDLNEVSGKVLEVILERTKAESKSAADLGLTKKEKQQYSLLRMVRATADKNPAKAGFELECSREIAQRTGQMLNDNTFYVPVDIQQRDMTVGTAAQGGYLVETSNVSFIEMLRNRMVTSTLGVRMMSGLQGNVAIPKQSAAATAYWLSTEATQITEANQTLTQVLLQPKTVGAYTEISRLLTLQSSPDAEGLVMSDLAQVVAIAVDKAVLAGAGSGGEPQGIIGTSGVGSVTGTSLAAAGVLEFMSDVAASNALTGSFAYCTTPAVAALLMARPELPTTGTTRLWTGSMLNGNLFGQPAVATQQMSAGTMLAGDYSQAILAEWGMLQVEVNPFANFQAGIIGVRAMYTIDVGVRQAAAFSYASSIT